MLQQWFQRQKNIVSIEQRIYMYIVWIDVACFLDSFVFLWLFFILVDSLLISTSPSYFFWMFKLTQSQLFLIFFLQIQMLKPFTVRSIVLGQDLSMLWYFQQIFEYSICAWKIALCIWFPFPSLLSNGASFFQNFHRIYEHV